VTELTPVREKELKTSRFIDLEKDKSRFYTNIFLENEDIVIKTPFPISQSDRKDKMAEFKAEKFDLTNYIYLVDY
jgi:hypothetical protein